MASARALFAVFAHDRDGVVAVSAHAAANLGQLRQCTVPIEVHRSELSCEQLLGKCVRRHATAPRLALEAVVGLGSEADYVIARCHSDKLRPGRAQENSRRQNNPVCPATTGYGTHASPIQPASGIRIRQ